MVRQFKNRIVGRKVRNTSVKARLTVELLEDRLTPSWAGAPPTSITPPSNPVAVTLNNQGDAAGNASVATTEVDYYRFTALATGTYTFDAKAVNSSIDTVIGIFSSTGARLGFNDDIQRFVNTDSRLSITLTAGRVYLLGVTNYTGSPGGNYSWAINGPTPPTDDRFEENDTISTATALGSITEETTLTNLSMRDLHDYYSFTIDEAGIGGSVSINFQHSQGDLDLKLFNSAGTRVGKSDSVTNSETISLSGLPAGTYFVDVYGYNGAKNPTYSLSIDPPEEDTGGGGGGGFSITLRITGMTASQQRIFQQAADRWAEVIVGDLPDAVFQGMNVDDVLIDGSGEAIDGPGGVLGQAGPDSFRSGSSLPIHGVMEFDTADLNQLEADGDLFNVIVHEMGHVLGIGTIWRNLGLLSGSTTTNPRFTGQQATAAYNAIFGTTAASVPVEGGGGAGTRNSHWRESVLGNELMTGFLDGGTNPLSRITVASLADMGYQVDLNAADNYSPPGGALRLGSSGGSSGGGSRGLRSLMNSISVADLTPGRQDIDGFFSLLDSPNRNSTPLPTARFGSNPTGPGSVRSLSETSSSSTKTSSSMYLTYSSHENSEEATELVETEETQPEETEQSE